MNRKQFSQEQIIDILKEAESEVTVADSVRKHSISEAPYYRWKSRFGGMDIPTTPSI